MTPNLAPPQPERRRKTGLIVGCCVALFVLFVIGSGFVVASLVAAGAALTGSGQPVYEEEVVREGRTDRKVVVIDVHGVILGEGFAESGIASAPAIIDQLAAADADPDVVAMILDINSPGGSGVASTRLYDAIHAAEKPVIALFSGDVAASGAVYAAVGADRIISHRETLTGSIGVIMEVFDVSQLLATYGVKVNTIKSGQFKDIGSFSREMTDAERTMLQGIIDESYANFVAVVAAGRGLSEERVREFADGRVFTGTTGHTLGLVDELGDLDTAIAAAEQLAERSDTHVVRYQEPFSFASLFSFFSSQFAGNEALAILQHLEENPELRLMYILE